MSNAFAMTIIMSHDGGDDDLGLSGRDELLGTVECASAGPVGKSFTAVRFFHLATVFRLMP